LCAIVCFAVAVVQISSSDHHHVDELVDRCRVEPLGIEAEIEDLTRLLGEEEARPGSS
jgi:hypothetical protein